MKVSQTILVLATLVVSSLSTPLPARRTSSHAVTDNTLSLTRSKAQGKTSSWYLRNYGAGILAQGTQVGSAPLVGAAYASDFLTNITIGTQEFLVVVDTGSSDTWVIESGFSCLGNNSVAVNETECGFGTSGFVPDSSFVQIPNENFDIEYADLETLSGILGTDTVTLAGIIVPNQEIALVNVANWDGDGISSGLTGLAYPSLTSAYPGTNPATDVPGNATDAGNNIHYSSIINTIFDVANLTAPEFSLALARATTASPNTTFGGSLTIGGIPNVTLPHINATGTFATTPIQILSSQTINSMMPALQFYTITIDTLVYPGSRTRSTQFIVDSGTTLFYPPTEDFIRIAELFDPLPEYDPDEGVYFVACDAVAPQVGVQIGGEVFEINPVDLIIDNDIGDDICVLGVQDGGPLSEGGPFILGDVFLNNVLAVFNVGDTLMEFSARPYYSTT